jgi:hypothetical protein
MGNPPWWDRRSNIGTTVSRFIPAPSSTPGSARSIHLRRRPGGRRGGIPEATEGHDRALRPRNGLHAVNATLFPAMHRSGSRKVTRTIVVTPHVARVDGAVGRDRNSGRAWMHLVNERRISRRRTARQTRWRHHRPERALPQERGCDRCSVGASGRRDRASAAVLAEARLARGNADLSRGIQRTNGWHSRRRTEYDVKATSPTPTASRCCER